MMVKTVYFDLGNVLIFFSLPKMFDQMSQCIGISPEEIRKFLFDTDLRRLYETGMINTEQLYRTFLKNSPKSFMLNDFIHSVSNIFTPNNELLPVVEHLKKKGIRLIILSNTCECHYQYVSSHYPILQLFDHKILSYEVGVWKPDARIFEKALARSRCKPEECFYTDDVPEFIDSARKVGLQGEIFTDVPTLRRHLSDRGLF